MSFRFASRPASAMDGLPLAAMASQPLLSVRSLTVRFRTAKGFVTVVDDVSFDVDRGEVLGLVGESGSGKSVTALALMRLLPEEAADIVGGQVVFEGRDLVTLRERDLRHVRGRRIGMVFQEPMTSLNPIASIGQQLCEPLRLHLGLGRRAALERAEELLSMVAMSEPRRRLGQYPHELSGGMRQRVVIAMALACEPSLIIADEPTTALDVTTQAQILDLLRDLRQRLGVSIIMITHDLGVVAEFADRVQVMYAGRAVERGPVEAIFARPQHPYTAGLLRSLPDLDGGQDRLQGIDGMVPSPSATRPSGCLFEPRCDRRQEACKTTAPNLGLVAPGQRAACLFPLHPADVPS